MNASFLLQHSFTYGALLSALMSALFLTGACLSPDVMLRGYPPDIKAKYGAISEQGNSIRKRMVAPLFLILLGTPIVSLI